MAHIQTATIPEQAAIHLREGIASGRWVGEMPGRDQLATELGVSPRSMQKALKILEKEGLLLAQGKGRSCKIVETGKRPKARPMRVALLLFKQADRSAPIMIELRHQLDDAGHITTLPHEGVQDLGMDITRVERLVRKTKADVWVMAGASREILQWFVDQNIKAFSLAGRRFNVDIAGTGPNKPPLYREVTQKLIAMGHQRIVMICSSILRLPQASMSARAFLETMHAAGIPTGSYNLPDWEDSAEGFHALLDSLFRSTPPTALILDEHFQFHAAYHYLAQRKLRVPQDVSMVCSDQDLGFDWCRPSVAHFHWDYQPVVRRIMRWVNNISRGMDDRHQGFTAAKYVDGGTVGPPPSR